MPLTTTDSELVLRAKTGDQGALAQIYERYAPALYRYIYVRVGEHQLAEDIRADVFVRVLESLHRYEDRGWPLSAWLYRIARDRTTDSLRRARRRRHVSLDHVEAAGDGPDQTTEVRLDLEEVYQLMLDLTDDQRQVIVLRFLADLPIHEVARRLGRSEGSVKALQHRGLQSLARRIAAGAPPAA